MTLLEGSLNPNPCYKTKKLWLKFFYKLHIYFILRKICIISNYSIPLLNDKIHVEVQKECLALLDTLAEFCKVS
jgi:hypothetical protein